MSNKRIKISNRELIKSIFESSKTLFEKSRFTGKVPDGMKKSELFETLFLHVLVSFIGEYDYFCSLVEPYLKEIDSKKEEK